LVLFALINFFYFITNPVKLYIAVQGFGRGKVINVTKKEIESIKDEEPPPLYHFHSFILGPHQHWLLERNNSANYQTLLLGKDGSCYLQS